MTERGPDAHDPYGHDQWNRPPNPFGHPTPGPTTGQHSFGRPGRPAPFGATDPYGQSPGTGGFPAAPGTGGFPVAPAPGTGGFPAAPPPQQPAPPSNGGGDGGRRRRTTMWVVLAVVLALLAGGLGGAVGAIATRGASNDSAHTVKQGSPSAPVTTQPPAKPGSVQDVAARTLPSVVSIAVQVGDQSGSGSGVVISSDGLIITNNHVVSAGGDRVADQVLISFNDGSRVRAKVIGSDKMSDIAVLRAEKKGLTPISVGKSDNLSVGQDVIAIGSPLGLEGTVTTGIISSLNRPVSTAGADGSIESVIDAIQTDAAINPGNSGGALVNATGALIGINTAIATLGGSSGQASGSIGLGFSIPIDQAMRVANQIIKGQPVTKASLGVNVRQNPNAENPGALVSEVIRGGAAEQARIPRGALITAVDDRKIVSSEALVAAIRSEEPGQSVKITYSHEGRRQVATVKLGTS
ncbi:MAG: trypsin-like peptidase domain-containing protein [Gordonia sp. (in: high G+C Gram-positive bacteria)]|uniref:S1C family serine protease n=1 Tax=Gordonia sp. (in: high G+C Gram-positive bacteria) TaxID=84139 RepID=UPI0039E41599